MEKMDLFFRRLTGRDNGLQKIIIELVAPIRKMAKVHYVPQLIHLHHLKKRFL